MARLRKFCAYRRLERPYTRISKFRKKSFIRARPHSKIVRFDMGNLKREFSWSIKLKARSQHQIRHNAIESARLASNRILEKRLGKSEFHFKLNIYPHHILRENPLASGAGADRMSTGMKKSFGKAIGSAARIREDQIVLTVNVEKENIDLAKKAVKRASQKLPCGYKIIVEPN